MTRGHACVAGSLALIAALALACSPAASASGSTAGASAAGQTTPIKPLPPTVCESHVVTVDDVSDLLARPIAPKPLPGDPQSCVFEGANFSSITFSVRPGLGDVSVDAWTSGKVPVSAVAVDGVGDKAVWQDTLRELIATKHNVLCDISANGARGSAADMRKKFTALCDRIWAAR